LFAFCGSLAACELTTRGASVVVVLKAGAARPRR
jgi:hypothetical protein